MYGTKGRGCVWQCSSVIGSISWHSIPRFAKQKVDSETSCYESLVPLMEACLLALEYGTRRFKWSKFNSNIETNADDLDAYIDSLENSSHSRTQSVASTIAHHIMFKLQHFDHEMSDRNRDPKSNHSLDFWELHEHLQLELKELGNIISATSLTDESVLSATFQLLHSFSTNILAIQATKIWTKFYSSDSVTLVVVENAQDDHQK